MFVILEGLDRTGKSTIAEFYKQQGFEYVHLSAPGKHYFQKGYTGPSYLDDMIELYLQYTNKDVVFDRSPWGELVWPFVFGRDPLLTRDTIEPILEIENSVNAVKYLMVDNNVAAHWKRCVDSKQPLDRSAFDMARHQYSAFTSFGFVEYELASLLAKLKSEPMFVPSPTIVEPSIKIELDQPTKSMPKEEPSLEIIRPVTPEKIRLMKANAIDQVLSKRIVKQRGDIFDTIEEDLRSFLNNRLAEMLGEKNDTAFTIEEVNILKIMCEQIKKKQGK